VVDGPRRHRRVPALAANRDLRAVGRRLAGDAAPGDPVDLGGWRVPLGWVLVLLFAGWNGWSLWLFARRRTGLLPGQATQAMIEVGPYRLSRNPLYVGLLALYLGLALLAPTFWGLVLFPAAVLLVRWGAIRPEERFLRERFGARYDDYTRRVRRWL